MRILSFKVCIRSSCCFLCGFFFKINFKWWNSYIQWLYVPPKKSIKCITLLKWSFSILWNSDTSTLTYKTLGMTDYELSNFVYLFLWLPAEGSKCARGHILLLLIAFRLNEKEFLACCLLFMKWKEITSCIISLPIVRFFFFFNLALVSRFICSRCSKWVL